ncbi:MULTISPECIES: DUF2939 domain-containing protein [unclassified Lysobacter]|uniref:DUF2939 domain-containing protein n=1 Tax=unclassified Lysobacter TaxID=2635362 RepID=UPI001C21CACA|nr:DUF2939 domain-containing protein [Lysobacter sp. MMG2]MBU8974677.1 DUF2939 domain-containing protein [Lysobacter sp. MMG2]
MKKWIALVVVVLLALAGWIAAGPFLTINSIREAVAQEDTAALSRHVDFDAVRSSLRAQVEDTLARNAGAGMQDNPLGAFALGLANRAAGGIVDMLATPAGIGAVLQGRGLLHRISGGGVDPNDGLAHTPPPDPLRDARYRFESPSRFTATVHNADGDPVVFVLTRDGLRWKLTDIRLPLQALIGP